MAQRSFSASYNGNITVANGETVTVENLNLNGSLELQRGGTLVVIGFLKANGRVKLFGNVSQEDIAKISSNDRVINQTSGGTYNSSLKGDYVQNNPTTFASAQPKGWESHKKAAKQSASCGKPIFSENGVTLNGKFRPFTQRGNQTGFWVEEEMYLGNYYEQAIFIARTC